MASLRSIRPLDAAIAAVAALVLVLGVFLGWSIWSGTRVVEESTPVGRAIQELRSEIRKKPNDINLRMELAQAYSVAGRGSDATEQYMQVLQLQKDYLPALSGLGFLAARQRDWNSSEEYWRRIIEILDEQPNRRMNKQWETANFYLGTTLLEKKEYEGAVSHLKEALRANGTAADTHYLLAAAYRGLEDDALYEQELAAALTFDPAMPEANYDYGRVLLKRKDIAGAAEHFRIAADEAPNRPEPAAELEKLGPAAKRLADARAAAQSDPKKALVDARIAVAVDPKDVEALLLLGKLQEGAGTKEDAAEVYRKVLALDAANKEAKDALSRVADE